MDLVEKVPQMTDDALQTLASNARRLVQAGTPAQQTAAQALLPAIDAELASRRTAKLATLAKARASALAARPAKRKAAKPKASPTA